MARAADQFRSSDITIWGIVAIACWGLAVLSANISAVVPASFYAALHSSRLEGGTVNQVRGDLAAVADDAAQLASENRELRKRLGASEENAADLGRRVSALEVSLPGIIEAQAAKPEAAAIDATETGAIGGKDRVVTFEADGGTVSVVQRPLLPGSSEPRLELQPLPAKPGG
jgi:hypothetical protein